MNKSLSKFIDIFLITLLLSIVLYVIVDIRNIFSTLKEIQKEKIIYTIKMENTTVAPLIKFDFKEALKKELKHLLEMNKAIKYIKINNLILGKNSNLELLTLPIIYHNTKIDNIIIGYSYKDLINSFSKKYFTKLVVYLLLVLFISIYFSIFIRRKVKSLNIVAKKVENINFKKEHQLSLIDNYFEIINITDAINKLLNQVNTFYINQKNLIKKIMIYKKELETAQKIADMFSWQYDCKTDKIISNNFSFVKHQLDLNSFEEFLNHIEEKKNLFDNIEALCRNNQNSFEEIITLNLASKKYYFKVEAKSMQTKDIIIGIFANITEEIQKQEEISFLAYHDSLTGLVNRSFLKEELKTLMFLSERNKKKLALIFIDLDNFKFVNDTFGHEIGDKLLIEIADRLKATIKKGDIAARIGGDEFVLILNNIISTEEVKIQIENIMKELINPIIIENNKMEVTFSAGISIYPDDAIDILELFQLSDIAMYEAKKSGKNRYQFITPSLKESVTNFYSTLEALKEGLEEEELILFFQPKVDIIQNQVIGVEALIRWKHPMKGLLTPYHFIDIAEKGGMIHLIDSYVLEKTIATLKRWSNDETLKHLSIAVNISANKFLDHNFVYELKSLINKYQINPSKLQIEITETLGIKNFEYTILSLEHIKTLGVQIALDDFGTGYSSLNYIKKIPFDVLKIDQSFIRDLSSETNDVAITKMIIEISKILKKGHVAEGVENETILKIVKKLGVEVVQGYYFSKPLCEKEFINYLQNFKHNS